MRVFKKTISASKVFLCASLLFNFLLIGAVVIAEKYSHVYAMALQRRGIIELDEKSYPSYWMKVAWTNTVEKLNTEFDVAFFGNSITCGSDFQSFFPDKQIINLGYPGDNIPGMIGRIPMLQASNPKKIFIMAGTNDLVHVDLQTYIQRYTELLTVIKDSIPQAKIYLESVLPSNHHMKSYASNEKVIQANNLVKSLAEEMGCTYVSLYELYVDQEGELMREATKDGVHLYPQHYDKWAEKIRPLIYE